ncbi:probable nucleoporin Nup54 [Agrilus planipennis]|uniref:Probable nucleoporin Nup54 n=1 Tax=Agrilus planipennis TaxID=224129 RepID=A0A1W4XEW7_AGRPL|nr:probable nucleoporin Nup54 [Agrilus planipennis]XP_018334559.1 probable nucleoporin Nup54 [Agrilus planipennis]
MSFGFGSSGQSAFGSTPNKPTAFAAPLSFGTPATTTASAGFGSFGSSFGTPSQQPTFGSTFGQQTATPSFGQPNATPAFGQSSIAPAFGQQTATPAFGQQAAAPVFGQQQVSAPAFGQQSATPAFGQQTATVGFGQPSATPSFGQPSAAPAFGQQSTAPAFGSTFGQSGTAAPAFGQAASTTPAFGSTFGATATSAPAFGGTFGAPATSTPSLFGSLQTSKPSLFSTPAASTTPSLFGTATTTAGGLFGSTSAPTGGLFGTTTTTQAPSLFGSIATSTPSLFGTSSTAPPLFGSATQPAGGGLFGTATTTQPSLFGSASAPQFSLGSGTTAATTTTSTGFSFFGPTTTSAPSLFGSLGTTTTTQSGFGGFGTTFPGFGTTASVTPFGTTAFGQKPLTAPGQTAAPVDKNQQVLASIYAINVFGDERDNVLKKWNMLQACWGTGKGYYSQHQPPIEYDHSNQFYRFKAVGYTVIPNAENSEGLVKLTFNKKESELMNQKDVLIKGLSGILGNKPNLTVEIETIKNLDGNRTEVTVIVSEKGATGQTRKIPASDLSSFLNQPMNKQQLTNVGVTSIFPYVTPTKAQIEEYLKNPGQGVDPTMWQMAQIDNPNPNKYLPTVINGFADLKRRMLTQEYETGLHRAFLAKVIREIKEVKSKHTASLAQIAEMKQKFLALQHRTLRILVKQECTRKVGMALQPEEEMLRARLEAMHAQLGIPNQYRGLLNELLSYVKLTGGFVIPKENYRIDSSALDDIKQFLRMQQNGISQLVNIINLDLQALKTINDGLKDLSKYQPKI